MSVKFKKIIVGCFVCLFCVRKKWVARSGYAPKHLKTKTISKNKKYNFKEVKKNMKTTTKNTKKEKIHIMSKKELNINDDVIKLAKNGGVTKNIVDLRGNKTYFDSLKLLLDDFIKVYEECTNEADVFVNSKLYTRIYEGIDFMLPTNLKNAFDNLPSNTIKKEAIKLAIIEASKGTMVRDKYYTNAYVMKHTTRVQPTELFRCIGRIVMGKVDLSKKG